MKYVLGDADKLVSIIKDHYLSPYVISSQNSGITFESDNEKPKIHSIYLYPIKSCASFKVSSWCLDSASLLYDRSFVIMQGRKTLTQKILPLLCMIKPKIDLKAKTMTISCPGVTEFVLGLELFEDSKISQIQETCVGNVCGDSIEGLDCGVEVSNWLEHATGLQDLKLVKLIKRVQRKSTNMRHDNLPKNLKSFANESQFLILNYESAKELEKNLPIDALEDLTFDGNEIQSRCDWIVEQFRGNIVIRGIAPFEEEKWKSIRIKSDGEAKDSVTFEVHGLCTRCNVISVDQSNGDFVQEPLKTLTKMEGRKFKFGVLASLKPEAKTNCDLLHSKLSTSCDLEILR